MAINKSIVALKYATAIGVLGVVFLAPGIAQSLDETEKDRIVTIQKEWADARVKPDIAYLERLYAKEFRVQTMTGAVASREDDIAIFREGRIRPDFVRDEDLNVSIYGEVAVVTGIENVAGTYPSGPLKGQHAELSIRFTNVFVHRDGRWQLVLPQGTLISQK
jgi:ketosteroid isomerase-like protein